MTQIYLLSPIVQIQKEKSKQEDQRYTIRLNSNSDRLGFIKENCEIIAESYRQVQSN